VDLAYLIAAGHERYREAANIAIRALRHLGGFRGDIAVLTDVPFRLPADVEQIPLEPADLGDRPVLKCRAGRKLDLECYQRVVYLDVDILVRAPLAPILDRCESGRLVATDDMGAKTVRDFFRRCFSSEELERYGGLPGINAGFFCAPGKRLRDWLHIWEETARECAGCPGHGFDQPPLNAAIRRGRIPLEYVPEQMCFLAHHWHAPDWAGAITEVYARTLQHAPLLHFTGMTVRPEQLRAMSNQYCYHLLCKPLRRLSA